MVTVIILVAGFAFVSCDDGERSADHVHAYTREAAEAKYLKSEASCTLSAYYYYSCECGDRGDVAFAYGSELPHSYDQKNVADGYLKNEATTENGADYYYSCKCGAKGTESFTVGNPIPSVGDTHTHSYTREAAEAKYLESEASCTLSAYYYYSCECGNRGDVAFAYGSELPHSYDQKNVADGYLKNEATTEKGAVYYYSCKCGEKGSSTFKTGNCAPHTYDQKKVSSTYLKSAATSSQCAYYYYSCKCGAYGTKSFAYGSANVSSGWVSKTKTVYAIKNDYVYMYPDSGLCMTFSVGNTFNVVASNGEWYKVSHSGNYYYVKVAHMTDDKGEVTFTDVSSQNLNVTIPDSGVTPGVSFGLDMSMENSSYINAWDVENIAVLAINENGTWIKVKVQGYDTNGGYHRCKKVLYCRTDGLKIE